MIYHPALSGNSTWFNVDKSIMWALTIMVNLLIIIYKLVALSRGCLRTSNDIFREFYRGIEMKRSLIMYAGTTARLDKRDFYLIASWLHNYLRKQTSTKSVLISGLKTPRGSHFLAKLRKLLKHREPVLVGLIGHGSTSGLKVTDDSHMEHERLAKVLCNAKAPTLVIVDSCHAFVLANACQQQGVNEDLVGVIAACPAEEVINSTEFVIPRVLGLWKAGQCFPETFEEPVYERCIITDEQIEFGLRARPPKVEVVKTRCKTLRWGAILDPLFFPTVS